MRKEVIFFVNECLCSSLLNKIDEGTILMFSPFPFIFFLEACIQIFLTCWIPLKCVRKVGQ